MTLAHPAPRLRIASLLRQWRWTLDGWVTAPRYRRAAAHPAGSAAGAGEAGSGSAAAPHDEDSTGMLVKSAKGKLAELAESLPGRGA
jgi:hypothetical protein